MDGRCIGRNERIQLAEPVIGFDDIENALAEGAHELCRVNRTDAPDHAGGETQGQARAKAEGRYKGRPENRKRNDAIAGMLSRGSSWSQIQDATGCSRRATIAKIAKRVKAKTP